MVDAANLLQPDQRAALDAKLKAHEDRTTDQVVVATVPTLGDLGIEDYANRLLRQWKLGQAGKNNGVLFLVAPRDRKVRIEVGYGLEGSLTDALSKIIITTAVAPRFQQNDFAGGLNAGVDAILSILTGDAEEWQRRAEVREDPRTPIDPFMAILIFFAILYVISRFMRAGGGTAVTTGAGAADGSWSLAAAGAEAGVAEVEAGPAEAAGAASRAAEARPVVAALPGAGSSEPRGQVHHQRCLETNDESRSRDNDNGPEMSVRPMMQSTTIHRDGEPGDPVRGRSA